MMKHFVLLAVSMILLSQSAVGAISATTQWDVRSTGSDTNGGGYDASVGVPGTDYSQQNSAQYAFTDMVIGATTTQFTSVLNPVVAAMVGNVIDITGGSGCTTGRYLMLSRSTITATMDRSMGTAASVCTGNLGGSLATAVTAGTASVDGNTINIKSGTYSGAITITAVTLRIIGFGTTHGDSGTKPLITTSANSILWALNGNGSYWMENLSNSSTAGTRNDGINPIGQATLTLKNSIFDGFRYALFGDNGARGYFPNMNLTNVEVKNSTTGGIFTVASAMMTGNYIHGNTGIGFEGRTVALSNNIFSTNTSHGVSVGTNSLFRVISQNAFYNNGGDGLLITDNVPVNNTVEGNIAWGNTLFGLAYNTAPGITPAQFFDYNSYGSNGSGSTSNWQVGPHDVTLTAIPWTNAPSGIFTLNNTAGGGAALKQAGYPGSLQGTTSTTGYLDIGPVQTSGAPGSCGQRSYSCVQ